MKTINGVRETLGIVSLKIKILNTEEIMNIFVIDETNFDHDFLIGLDCVTKFKLRQNEKLEISQKIMSQTNEDDLKSEIKIPECTGKTPQSSNEFEKK